MKKNDFKNMKVKKVEELRKTVSEKKTELTKLLSKKAASGEKNLKEGKNLRREIAQILTLAREKELI